MLKNRIWKKMKLAALCLLTQTGIWAGCIALPTGVRAAEPENNSVVLTQSAAWTDLEKFQAVVSVKAKELGKLTENDSKDSYELVVWLSEYFLPAASFEVPKGCLREETPVNTEDGRYSSITGFRWKIDPGEIEKQLDIPVTLREEYRFPVEKRTISSGQDTLYIREETDGGENPGGIYILKKTGREKKILAKTVSQKLEIPAAYIDFFTEMKPREESIFSGNRILMEVDIVNNGQIPLYGISFEANVREMDVIPVWEKEPGFESRGNHAVLESLTPGEKRSVSFYIDPEAGYKGNLNVEIQAGIKNPVSLERIAESQLTIQPLKAAFTVKKTADCETARPGDTVTYQISIHNTGEQTLHSVITTERFGLAGVTAVFLEQEGVTLNRSKTQAKISEIVPDGCVNLKARVVLPEKLENQSLINQVIVVTEETGEEQAVRDQASIEVDAKEKKSGGSGADDGEEKSLSPSPKTGDRSHKELFQALILLSLLFSVLYARRMFFGRKD